MKLNPKWNVLLQLLYFPPPPTFILKFGPRLFCSVNSFLVSVGYYPLHCVELYHWLDGDH